MFMAPLVVLVSVLLLCFFSGAVGSCLKFFLLVSGIVVVIVNRTIFMLVGTSAVLVSSLAVVSVWVAFFVATSGNQKDYNRP